MISGGKKGKKKENRFIYFRKVFPKKKALFTIYQKCNALWKKKRGRREGKERNNWRFLIAGQTSGTHDYEDETKCFSHRKGRGGQPQYEMASRRKDIMLRRFCIRMKYGRLWKKKGREEISYSYSALPYRRGGSTVSFRLVTALDKKDKKEMRKEKRRGKRMSESQASGKNDDEVRVRAG